MLTIADEGGKGVSQKLTIADEGGTATFWKNIVISTAGALRIDVVRDFRPSYHPTNHPFIAFEHLSLKKNSGQSVALCGILWKGKSW